MYIPVEYLNVLEFHHDQYKTIKFICTCSISTNTRMWGAGLIHITLSSTSGVCFTDFGSYDSYYYHFNKKELMIKFGNKHTNELKRLTI